jgi:tRNA pseudouridine38-40 synthase
VPRFALGVEYDGRPFLGWQRQRQTPTVQAVLEDALAVVADAPCQVHAAGRTDTGVHARGQVAHFDSDAARSPRQWLLGVNSQLPEPVAVTWVKPVADDFHARFSATARCYEYLICNRPVRPGLDHGRVAWVRRPLDAERMHEAAQVLLGEHDFSAFRARGCQASSPVRELQAIEITRHGDRLRLGVRANAFLYHMVRNLAGSLIEVGLGDRDPGWLSELLQGRDRRRAGATAPAAGLYFRGAVYPVQHGLPSP